MFFCYVFFFNKRLCDDFFLKKFIFVYEVIKIIYSNFVFKFFFVFFVNKEGRVDRVWN